MAAVYGIQLYAHFHYIACSRMSLNSVITLIIHGFTHGMRHWSLKTIIANLNKYKHTHTHKLNF